MHELYNKYRWKIVGIAAVLAVVYIIFVVLIPNTSRAINTYQQIQERKEKINSVDNWEHKLKRYKGQQQKLKKFFSNLFVSVSRSDKISSIVSLVYKKGDHAGVDVQQIQPLKVVQRSSFTEVPVKITTAGKFYQILRFVNGLEQANRLVQVSKIDMLTEGKSSSDLQAKIQLKVVTVQKMGKAENNDE